MLLVLPNFVLVKLEDVKLPAVHAMKRIFALPSVEGVLLVDATNAFNELNRQVTLRNVEVVCPVLAPILANTYRQDALLFSGGNTILSSEGTTQGDLLAMAICMLLELCL